MKNFTLRFGIFLAFCCFTFSIAQAQQCVFRLDMHDDFGDGWNDGVLTVNSGGVATPFSLVATIGDGTDSTVFFSVSDGMPLTLSWLPGDFNFEVSFSLYNNNGDLIFSATDPAAGQIFQATAACVACVKPVNVLLENVYDNRAKVRWTPGIGTSTPVGWLVIYGAAGFTPGPGAGDTLSVTTPKATIPGLQKKTFYDFYVQQICANSDTGSLVGPIAFETYLSDDVGISAVLTPQSGCDLGTEIVTIALSNFGANPQSLITYNYSVNGIPAGVPMPQDGLYTGVLGKDSTTVIEFETTFNFSESGEYQIAVWTEFNGDENSANDTFYFYVVNRLQLPYAQDFETWSGGWFVDTASVNSSWEFGKPQGVIISAAASGQNAWVTQLSGLYQAEELSYLQSPCFDFSDLLDDPVLEFSVNYVTETEYDGCSLELSLDDGTTWTKVGAIDEGLNWYNIDNVFNDLGEVWAGNSGGWLQARHHLDGAAGSANVRLRFAFGSDPFGQFEGVGIDDIRIFLPLTDDLAAVSVATGGDGQICGLEDDTVIFRFVNLGAQAKTLFNLAYSLNGAAPVVENIGAVTVLPDEVFEYTFTQTFDSRDGVFDIRCWTNLAGEQDLSNDTSGVYTVNYLPKPVPVQENFEAGLPAGWATDGFVTAGHNNSSQVLAVNLYEFITTAITDLPRVGFIEPMDSLRFDYRITNFDSEGTVATVLSGGTKFEVLVSTDCGDTFETLHTIDQTNHVPAVGLQTVVIGLGAYAGQAVILRFASTWGAGDFYFDIDNINLRACPPNMQLSADIVPAAPDMSNGSVTVQVGLGNPPYQYLWSTGATTATATGLPVGPVTVTVTDDLGCSDVLTVQIGSSPVREIEGLMQLALMPNPSQGLSTLLVRFDHPVDLQVQVLDLLGRTVWQRFSEQTIELTEQLDLLEFPDGLYLVRLSSGGGQVTKKLLKAK